MAFKEMKFLKRASDLLIDHKHFNFSNANANITPPAAGAIIPFGTVVFRAKGLVDTAPWAAVSAAGDLSKDNEYALVWGDHHAFAADFVPRAIAAGKWNSIIVRNGAAKEFYIKQVHGTALAADFALLKSLMDAQGLLVLDDVTKYTV